MCSLSFRWLCYCLSRCLLAEFCNVFKQGLLLVFKQIYEVLCYFDEFWTSESQWLYNCHEIALFLRLQINHESHSEYYLITSLNRDFKYCFAIHCGFIPSLHVINEYFFVFNIRRNCKSEIASQFFAWFLFALHLNLLL